MVKSLFNSLSLCKECCNLKSTNELALLIISLANPGFQSRVNLKTIQRKSKKDSTLSTSTPTTTTKVELLLEPT